MLRIAAVACTLTAFVRTVERYVNKQRILQRTDLLLKYASLYHAGQ